MPYKNKNLKRAANLRAYEKARKLGKAWAVKERKPRPPAKVKVVPEWKRQRECAYCPETFMPRFEAHTCCGSVDCVRQQQAARDKARPPRDRKYHLKPEAHARKLQKAAEYRIRMGDVLRAKDREIKRKMREADPAAERERRRKSKQGRILAQVVVARNAAAIHGIEIALPPSRLHPKRDRTAYNKVRYAQRIAQPPKPRACKVCGEEHLRPRVQTCSDVCHSQLTYHHTNPRAHAGAMSATH